MVLGILFVVDLALLGIVCLTSPAEPLPWRNSATLLLLFLALVILGVIVIPPLLQGH